MQCTNESKPSHVAAATREHAVNVAAPRNQCPYLDGDGAITIEDVTATDATDANSAQSSSWYRVTTLARHPLTAFVIDILGLLIAFTTLVVAFYLQPQVTVICANPIPAAA